MKNMTFKRSKLGFTLAELLLVVAILVILVGLGVTGFVALRQNIIIAKYDDLAREIYVAAQNQLTRLEANGLDQITLDALNRGESISSMPADYAAGDWEKVKDSFRYAARSNTQPMTVLLPLGAVADDVRSDGYYVIEYNVQTRTVYGVFYSAKSFEYADVSKITSFRTNRSVRKGPMVGYYGGSAVERDPLTHCEVPKLQIINNNELRLKILNVPTGVTSIRVSVFDGEKTENATVDMVPGESGSRTVLLDSLEPNKHFWNIFHDLTPGKNLTITVTYEKDKAISSSASISANSLFATREPGTAEGDVVTLAWARHLQNLETTVSGLADDKIAIARQTEHIQWEDGFGPFVSISNTDVNNKLLRFEGNNLEIRDLRGSNGLFAQTKEGMTLSGIRIVNPVIAGDPAGTQPVGALVGTAVSKTVIHMCGVYANKLNNNQTVAYDAYQDCYVDGKTAITGGLVGQATNTTVTSSFAALPSIKGGHGAALIGSASGCTIENSYANCDDLDPDFNYFVAGNNKRIAHCYAAGNVESPDSHPFAGATDELTDCYYAVSHRIFAPNWSDNVTLSKTQFEYTKNGSWVSINQEQMQNATTAGGWAAAWENVIAPQSHPYRRYLNGRPFPYPAIGDLDHYGSWPDDDGTVKLIINMALLNNEGAGYAVFAGRVIVTDNTGAELFDSEKHKNADGSFDGENTILVTPDTRVTIKITTAIGYEYLYTTVDGTRYPNTAEPSAVEYTVTEDTEAVVTFRQKAFELIGKPAVNAAGIYIDGSSYGIDLTSPVKTIDITNNSQSETVETGSTVTVRPTAPEGYSGCVVWYEPKDNTDPAKRTYVTPDANDNYTFTMPAGHTEVHVMYTDKEAFFKIEYYLMDTAGGYPDTPTQTASYKCGLGSQINQSMINAFAESSGLPLTIGTERVRYFEEAIVTSNQSSEPIFHSMLDTNGTVTVLEGPYLTAENESSEEQPYLVKIYIARKEYRVTLTAETHVSGVRFGNTGNFQRTVTQTFRYGASVTAQADVAPGYHFAYWDPQDSRFMMSAETVYTFQVPQFDLHLKATAAMDRFLVTINLQENDESWLYSSPSRQADPITLTLVNSKDPSKTYPMQVLTEDTISYAMQAAVPAVEDYGAGYYVRVNYKSGLETWLYTSDTQEGTGTQNERLLLYVRDKAVEKTAKFYSVTYHPNLYLYSGTAPKGGTYPMYYRLMVEGNTGLLRNLSDDNKKVFSGWKDYYAQGTGSDTTYTGNQILVVTKRTDLFAQWVESLSVIYHDGEADGGELPLDPGHYQQNEWVTIQMGSLTRKGHQFIGWSRTENAQTPEFTKDGETYQLTSGNLNLYPVWEQEEYQVQFYDTDGKLLTGTDYNIPRMHYGETITAPSLTVDGGQIIGWSLTKGGEIVCRPGEQYPVTGDTKLYACLAVQQVTVTYQSGDGHTTYKTEKFGLGIPGYLNCVPQVDGKPAPVTAWSTKPNGQGTLYLCDESGRSEKAFAFMKDTTLYAVTGKVYNYNMQLWFNTLYDAVRSDDTQNGHTLIVYRDTEEPHNIWINKNLYIMASGNRTVKWKDGATVAGSSEKLSEETAGEFVGCMNVSNNGSAVTVEFGRSDIPTLLMEGNTLTFDASRQSRVISLSSGATFHMYDGITLTNGYRTGNKTGNGNTTSNRTGYGGGVYAGRGSVFYMHGGTVSFCEAVSGGGVYLITGSRMYMGDMVLASSYSATATYYTKVHDEDLNEDIYINADGVTQENFKQFYVTAGNPVICYNNSTHDPHETYGDGGGGLLMLDLNNGELTLFRGSIINNTTTANGGGIMTDSANDNCFLRIYEVDVSHNTAAGNGGGIFQWHGTVYVYNSTIRQNRAKNGGGIYLKNGGGVYNIEFYFGDISDNEAIENGGGVYEMNGAKFFLRGGNVRRNKAINGGGVYLAGGNALLSFEKGTLSDNTVTNNGGGVSSAGRITMSGGTLSGNYAGNWGGGIYFSGTTTMSGGTICDNSARYLGGGMMVGGTLKLSGGSLYGNTDTDYPPNNHRVDEDNVNQAPNDIYLMGDRVINIPKDGIALSGEERVAVDCERDASDRFNHYQAPNRPPYRFAVYEDETDFHEDDHLYFTYYGTRSTQYSIQTNGRPDLTVVTHQHWIDETTGVSDKATGLYFVEEQAGMGQYSYVIFDQNYPDAHPIDPKRWPVGTVLNLNDPTVLPAITREGYYLAGWARTPDAVEEQYVLFYDVEENAWKSNFRDGNWTTTATDPKYAVQNLFSQTLYAMWRPCVVVYDLGEGKDYATIQPISIGPRVTLLNPTPMSYTANGKTFFFDHWVKENSTETYTSMQQVNLTENLRLRAVWTERVASRYIITFHFNAGTSSQTGELRREVEAEAGKPYDINVDIHQANKILVGWSTNPDGTGTTYEPNGTIGTVEHDMNLYAIWTDAVTLTYDVNGGSGSGMVVSIAQGGSVEITTMKPTRLGYDFLGWAETPDAATAKYVAGNLYTQTDLNTTLYAVWERNQSVRLWQVSFNLAGGTGDGFEAVEVLDGDTFTLPLNMPAKEGCTFMGWNMGTWQDFTPGDSVEVKNDIVFTAVWLHTVTFNLDGGTWDQPESAYVREGGECVIPNSAPEKEGFAFLYWQTETGETFSPNQSFVVSSDMKLTAVWGHSLTFNLQGGTDERKAFDPVVLPLGGQFTIPTDAPVKDGFVFQGWAETATAKTADYTSADIITLNQNTTLYAVWVQEVTLTLNLNGGSIGDKTDDLTKQVELGSNVSLSEIPTREGYNFKGWAETATAKVEQYAPNGVITVDKDMTLYAVWAQEVTLTLNLNGGSINGDPKDRTKAVELGTEVSLSDFGIPTRDGYIFKGWSEDPDTMKVDYTKEQKIPVGKNTILYAVWVKEVTLSFDTGRGYWTNGYKPPESKGAGETFTLPRELERWVILWSESVTSWEITYGDGTKAGTYQAGEEFTIPEDQETVTFKAIF